MDWLLMIGIFLGIAGGIFALFLLVTSSLEDWQLNRRWARAERELHREYINGIIAEAVDHDDPLHRFKLREALVAYRELP